MLISSEEEDWMIVLKDEIKREYYYIGKIRIYESFDGRRSHLKAKDGSWAYFDNRNELKQPGPLDRLLYL